MKVVQILPELKAGGVERGTLEVGKYLVDQGHESIVISNGGRLVARLEAEGSRHITLPVQNKRFGSLKQVKILRSLFEEERPDIIHLRSRLPAWLAYLAWRKMEPLSRPRLVTTVHGFYSVNAYSRIMTRGEQVICVSNSIKDYVRKNYPDVPENKLTVIHRGVDPAMFPYGFQPSANWLKKWQQQYPQLEGKYVITLPGRITRWKGQLDFIRVIAGLKEKEIPVHGLIVGEPNPNKLEFFEQVKSAIGAAGVENNLTIVGHRNDLREVMAISDVVVSCSTDPEAFGRVTLEALAIGKPVAAYAHGGVGEQLSRLFSTGCVQAGNTTEMVEYLSKWQKNPPEIDENTEFTLDSMLKSINTTYKELLSKNR